ncbi:MAG TPA: hypothetical protein ENH94_10245 [Phycisphaerales bacterium]|nr:hypothetical protein [Phycisphaerales bacterium]
MSRMAAIFRFILFCVFFSVGASAIVLSILTDELQQLYEGRAVLQSQQVDNDKIAALIDDYDGQIRFINQDPNVLKRLARSTFGTEPVVEDTAFPRASDERLEAARKALLEETDTQQDLSAGPQWLERCRQPRFRQSLFIAGAGLVLITFIFFGTPAKITKKPE